MKEAEPKHPSPAPSLISQSVMPYLEKTVLSGSLEILINYTIGSNKTEWLGLIYIFREKLESLTGQGFSVRIRYTCILHTIGRTCI